MSPALTAAVILITYAIKAWVEGYSSLKTSQAFINLALISLVTTPATELLTAFSFVASCLGRVQRIQEHLMKPSRHDERALAMEVVRSSKREASSGSDSDARLAHLSQVKISMFVGPDYILRDLDLTFHQNTYAPDTRPERVGEFTLLKAVLREANYSGDISVRRKRIAYFP